MTWDKWDQLKEFKTVELESAASQLHTHRELFGLDADLQEELNSILAELDQRGAL